LAPRDRSDAGQPQVRDRLPLGLRLDPGALARHRREADRGRQLRATRVRLAPGGIMSVAAASPLRYSHSIGVLGHGGRGFSNPVDVAIRGDGVLFVLNRSNPTQGPPGGLRVGIVTISEEFLGDFGSYGTEDGQFVWLT